jgi:hypothetical protein
MTSLTTILGLLPLALGIGEGAELQSPLALTVMGGLTATTFLTLVFIPALYVIVTERFEKKLTKTELDFREDAVAFTQQIKSTEMASKMTSPPEEEQVQSIIPKPEMKPVETPIKEISTTEKGQRESVTPQPEIIPSETPAEEISTTEKGQRESVTPQPEIIPSETPVQEISPPEEKGETKLPQPQIKPAEVETPREEISSIEQKETEDISKPEIKPSETPMEKVSAPEGEQPERLSVPQEVRPIEMPIKEIIPPPTPSTEKDLELNSRQSELLEKLKTLKKISRKQYAEMFQISIPTAARDLKELVERKLLKPRGPLGPGRLYELIEGKE